MRLYVYLALLYWLSACTQPIQTLHGLTESESMEKLEGVWITTSDSSFVFGRDRSLVVFEKDSLYLSEEYSEITSLKQMWKIVEGNEIEVEKIAQLDNRLRIKISPNWDTITIFYRMDYNNASASEEDSLGTLAETKVKVLKYTKFSNRPKPLVVMRPENLKNSVWYGQDSSTGRLYQASFIGKRFCFFEIDTFNQQFLYNKREFHSSFCNGYWLTEVYDNEDWLSLSFQYGYIDSLSELIWKEHGLIDKGEWDNLLSASKELEQFQHPLSDIKKWQAMLSFKSNTELELILPRTNTTLYLKKDILVSSINKEIKTRNVSTSFSNLPIQNYSTDSSTIYIGHPVKDESTINSYKECMQGELNKGNEPRCSWSGGFVLSPQRNFMILRKYHKKSKPNIKYVLNIIPIRPTTIAEYDSTQHWFEFTPPPTAH